MIIEKSLSVDAGYSSKTGIMDYRAVWTDNGAPYFEKSFSVGTNNIGEFLAVVHALAKLKEDGLTEIPVYTDSVTAMAWVRNKKVKTTLYRGPETEKLWKIIDRAEKWLRENDYDNEIMKWETSKWGEIKADFDRK